MFGSMTRAACAAMASLTSKKMRLPVLDNSPQQSQPEATADGSATEVDPLKAELEPVDELMLARDAAVARLARFSRFDEAINRAYQTREAATVALRQFVGEETAALRTWAESGEGEAPPSRNVDAYAALVSAVDDADRASAAAVEARAIVEPSVAMARAELLRVQIQLDHRHADVIAADGLRAVDELRVV